MKIDKLDRCLTGKLKLIKREAARYADYQLICLGQMIPMPTLLRVSHGSGELTGKNLAGIAKGLGLNEHTVKDMVGCRIGRACVLVCFAVRLLEFIRQHRQDEGEVFRPGLLAMLESIELLLQEPELQQSPRWTVCEKKALTRAREILEPFLADEDFGPVATQLHEHMAAS